MMRILTLTLVLLVACKFSGEAERIRASKTAETWHKARRYSWEAYPSWATDHRDKACPQALSDLSAYTDYNDTNDSWGRPLRMFCGSTLPPGSKGFAVLSLGADGKEGTADDIKSWE